MKLCHLLIAITLMTANLVQAQTLWGGARVGMNIEEAMQTQPLAYRPSDQGKISRTGDIELLRVDNIDVGATENFKASLYFSKTEKLVQVNLAPMKSSLNIFAGRSTFNSMLLGLKAKYGAPVDVTTELDGGEATWVIGKTKIILLYGTIGTISFVNAIYAGNAAALGSGL